MPRLPFLYAVAVAVLPLTGCERQAAQSNDNSAVLSKLDEISKKLSSLEEKIEEAAPVKRDAGPKRLRPDPNKTYAIAVGDSPYKGPKHAKVTIVEAFEYA